MPPTSRYATTRGDIRASAQRAPSAQTGSSKKSGALKDVDPALAEHRLLKALRGNVPGAFELLLRRYGDYLYRVALRMTRGEAEARDTVQDAFISALHHIHDFQANASLKTWLYRLTVSSALMRMRSARRRREISIEELVPALEGVRDEPEWLFVESVETGSARTQLRATVRQCIERLPDSYRVVLVLRDIEGHDTREAALLLGESESNIKVRLHRARAALKTLLEPLYRAQAL